MARPTGKWRGGRQCSVCRHPQRGRIDYLIIGAAGEHGYGRRVIAEKFGLNSNSVYNHTKNHISDEYRRAVLAGPLSGSERDLRELAADEGTSVLQNFRALYNGQRDRWLVALEASDDPVMISHGRQMTEMLAKIARITHEIAPPVTLIQNNVNLLDNPEYVGAITTLTRALAPYPEACRAAAAALRALASENPLIEAAD